MAVAPSHVGTQSRRLIAPFKYGGLARYPHKRALDRFQEPLNRRASREAAFGAIRHLLAYGIVRTSPRSWTATRHEPNCRCVYSDLDPDVCLIVDGDAVVTVLTRDLCRPEQLKVLPRPSGSRSRPQAYDRRWDLESAWDAHDPLPADLAQVS